MEMIYDILLNAGPIGLLALYAIYSNSQSEKKIEMLLERRKSEALFSKNDIVQNKPSFIQNIRNNKKKKNEFLDTIEQRIQNLENLHKDKYNYTF